MRKLQTIQTKENLNEVFAVDEKGNGGANHKYHIKYDKHNNGYISTHSIDFQNGARKEDDSIHGVIDSDLLEIVRDRLISFQAGPYASIDNMNALSHVVAALVHLNNRVEDRVKRNVLGKNEK